MTLLNGLRGAAGAVTGRTHRLALRDGQDGTAVLERSDVRAVIVTDGCSSGRHSEVGARIGAAWLAVLVAQHFHELTSNEDARQAANAVTQTLVTRLELLARSLAPGGELDPARIEEHLLFTFLVAVITEEHALVFGVGDGLVVVNDVTMRLDPGPDNAPLYAAYALLGSPIAPTIHFSARAADVEVLAVATDGLEPHAKALPALVSDPRLVANPSLLRKRLVVLADEGALHDDAALGVLQRLP